MSKEFKRMKHFRGIMLSTGDTEESYSNCELHQRRNSHCKPFSFGVIHRLRYLDLSSVTNSEYNLKLVLSFLNCYNHITPLKILRFASLFTLQLLLFKCGKVKLTGLSLLG